MKFPKIKQYRDELTMCTISEICIPDYVLCDIPKLQLRIIYFWWLIKTAFKVLKNG